MPRLSNSLRPAGRRQSQPTRTAILQAALREFAHESLAGARTDAIARAAGVNKAMLYYYFRDKEQLYGAVLDHVFAGLAARVDQAMERNLPPREKLLAYVAAHFDYIAAQPLYPRIVQREMMRAGRGGSPHMRRLVDRYFRPFYGRLIETLRQGMASGEFRSVDPMQFIYSVVAMIVFYFSSAPVIEVLTRSNPLTPERIRQRRAAILDLVSAALFCSPVSISASRKGKLIFNSKPRRKKMLSSGPVVAELRANPSLRSAKP